MSTTSYVRGAVRDADDPSTARDGVLVELGTRSGTTFTRLLSTTTTTEGTFSFNLVALPTATSATRYEVRVWDGADRLTIRRGKPQWTPDAPPTNLVLHVTAATPATWPDLTIAPPATGNQVVSGRVRHLDGTPVTSGSAQLYQTGYAGSVAVGTPVTVSAGVYRIEYPEPSGRAPNLFVRVIEGGDPLGVSDVVYKAGATERLDVDVEDETLQADTEFTRLADAITEALDTTPLTDLTPRATILLARDAGFEADQVLDYVVASRLATRLGSSTLHEALYGLLRAGWPASVRALLQRARGGVDSDLSAQADLNVIARTVADGAGDVLEALTEAQIDRSMDTGVRGSIGPLLLAAGLSEPRAREVLGYWNDAAGDNAAFWQKVEEASLLGVGVADTIREILKLATAVCNHLPMVEAIVALPAWAGKAEMITTLDAADWEALIDDGVDWPDAIPDEGDGQRAAYLAALLRHAKSFFPSKAAKDAVVDTEAATFLAANPSFDLGRSRVTGTDSTARATRTVQRLYRAAGGDLGGGDRASALNGLMAGTSGRPLRSARDVTRVGGQRFLDTWSATLGEAEARTLLSKSRSLHGMSTALYTANHRGLRGATFTAFGGMSEPSTVSDADLPSYTTVFGGTPWCACEGCRSATSPAAYLYELLRWVDERDGWTDKLAAKRPDLGEMKLDCHNTDRALPYIDLVIEVLENAVAPGSATEPITTDAESAELVAVPQYVNAAAWSTLRDAIFPARVPYDLWLTTTRRYLGHLGVDRAQLMRAWDRPSDARYPDAAHIAMEQLGLSETLDAVLTNTSGTANAATLWGYATTGELSALTASARTLLHRGGLTHPELQDLLHNRLANPEGSFELESGDDPCVLDGYTLAGEPTATDWGRIARVIRLGRALGWDFITLDKVAGQLGWVSGFSALTEGQRSDLAELRRLEALTGLGPVELSSWFGTMDTREDRDGRAEPIRSLYERIYLAPSLVSKTDIEDPDFPLRLVSGAPAGDDEPGADHAELLMAALSLDSTDFTAAGEWIGDSGWLLTLANLTRLHAIAGLSQAADLDVADTFRMTVLADLDPFDAPENARVFLETVKETRAPGFQVDTLAWVLAQDADATARVGPDDTWKQATLGAVRDAARAALGGLARHDDLREDPAGTGVEAVLAEIVLDADGAVDTVTIASLMTLLAKVPPTTYTSDDRTLLTSALGGLTDITPVIARLAPASPGAEFLDNAPDRYAYLLWVIRHAQALAAREPDADGTRVRAALSEVLVDANGATFVSGVTAVMDLLAESSALGSTPMGILVGWLGRFTDSHGGGTPEVLAQRFAWSTGSIYALSSPPDRYAYVLWLVRRWQARERARASVLEALAGALETSRERIERLRGRAFAAVTEAHGPWTPDSTDLTDVLLDDDFVHAAVDPGGPWSDIDAARQPAAWTLIEVLRKLQAVIDPIGVDEDELTAWLTHRADFDLLDLTALDTTARDLADCVVRFARLKTSIDLFRQRERLPGTTPAFAELLDVLATVEASFPASLASRTGWDSTELLALRSTLVMGPGADDALVNVPALERLLDAWEMLRRAGVSVSTVESARWWSLGTLSSVAWPTQATANSLVRAARARHRTPEAWAAVARPLRDTLRQEQRDALVAWLLAREAGNPRDANTLYERYLIDVQMEPWLLTSRVKQAACSVQLYVQRCMLGLEEEETAFTPTEEDREEWAWMKTYRVWEAARRVFLYPESWIEPELRQDKSHLFEQLESELAQSTLEPEHIDRAVLAYVDGLHAIAMPQVLAMFWQEEQDDEGTIDVLHVFARTRGNPSIYLYRRWEDRSRWTAWEPVECGVEGDHLIPVVSNRRLLLYWLVFQAQANTDTDPASEYWEIQLNASEYRDGRWGPKVVAEDTLALSATSDYAKLDITNYGVGSSEDEDGLTLTVYVISNGSFSLGRFEVDAATGSVEATLEELEATRYAFFNAPNRAAQRQNLSAGAVQVYHGAYDDARELVGEPEGTLTLFKEGNAWRFVVPNQYDDFVAQAPFFVECGGRTWFMLPSSLDEGADASAVDDISFSMLGRTDATGSDVVDDDDDTTDDDVSFAGSDTRAAFAAASAAYAEAEGDEGEGATSATLTFDPSPFYHPFTRELLAEARRNGVLSMYLPNTDGGAAELARQAKSVGGVFKALEPTNTYVNQHTLAETFDFSSTGALSCYNWELFFHVPLLVATRLTQDQRFEQAMDWFHTVFDPRQKDTTLSEDEQWRSFWRIQPFYTEDPDAAVTDWIAFTGDDGDDAAAAAYQAQVEAWLDDPFDPHGIARLRPGTYAKVVVMRYLDNLVAWGDHLFAQDTIESLNEATQLYVYAWQILGEKPDKLEPSAEESLAASFNEIEAGRVAVDGEDATTLVESTLFDLASTSLGSLTTGNPPVPDLGSDYFTVLPNDRLSGYWDTVADRLFKIRNGMNLEGQRRSLPLFDPPIDPALLVKASAAGLTVGSVLADTQSVLPNYRFTVMVQKAQAFCGTVRALGQSLLSVLEKRDAEALALLRSGQEIALLDTVGAMKEEQLAEAKAGLEAAKAGRKNAEARRDYYERLRKNGDTPRETEQVKKLKQAARRQEVAGGLSSIASLLAQLPDITLGVAPGATFGGPGLYAMMMGTSAAISTLGAKARLDGDLAGIQAGRARRKGEWDHQITLANSDITATDKAIAAAEIRVAIAEKDIANHRKQADNAQTVDAWMRNKYSNQALYDWMVGQIASVYFRAYQLAYETARKAEACYRHEIGDPTASFVQYGHWDNLRKGLLSGERLGYELDRMEAAYLDNDRRELELVRHVSLDRLDPAALERLRVEGSCYFALPESLFDLDCPGHYFRRLVSVGVTLACVSGPQSTVNAELRLESSQVRRKGSATEALTDDPVTSPMIVTSSGLEDQGLFQADLRDPRYLPFERKGAVSAWQLRFLASQYKQLDWTSVTDVIVHLRYTARDGGDTFRGTVEDALAAGLNAREGGRSNSGDAAVTAGAVHAWAVRRDFPEAWFAAAEAESGFELTLALEASALPVPLQGESAAVNTVYLLARSGVTPSSPTLSVTVAGFTTSPTLTTISGLPGGIKGYTATLTGFPTALTFAAADTGAFQTTVEDMVVVLGFGLGS